MIVESLKQEAPHAAPEVHWRECGANCSAKTVGDVVVGSCDSYQTMTTDHVMVKLHEKCVCTCSFVHCYEFTPYTSTMSSMSNINILW